MVHTVIPALGQLEKKDKFKFKFSLGNILRLCFETKQKIMITKR